LAVSPSFCLVLGILVVLRQVVANVSDLRLDLLQFFLGDIVERPLDLASIAERLGAFEVVVLERLA